MTNRSIGAATSRSMSLCAELQLGIGAIATTIASRDPDLALTVPDAVARFIVQGAASDIAVGARWHHDMPRASGRVLFDSGGLWQLRDAGRQLSWSFTSPKFGRAPYKTAVFERDFSAGEVYLHQPYFDASAPIYPLEYPLDELILTNWLALGRGVEIHACAVRDANGAGYLFAGHSGAGKTTLASLWHDVPHVTVLSDDRVILRRSGNQIWMYGTPWHGDEPLASPTSAPLTHGFFLHHAPRNLATPVGQPRAAAALLVCSFPPFYSASGLEFTLSFLRDVTDRVPFSDLKFLPDPDAISLIRSSV